MISFIIFFTFAMIIESSGMPKRTRISSSKVLVEFDQIDLWPLAHFLNFVSFIFFTQFLLGCQHFVIAGTVGKWYFSREKWRLGHPIQLSFKNLIRYHLGSICLGSMFITIAKVLRFITSLVKVRGMQISKKKIPKKTN